MSDKNSKHPTAFYVMLFWQFFWAFSFYGLWSLLPVYLNQELKLDAATSFAIFGGYTALGAGLLFVGGWIADNFLGAKRSLIFGTIFQSTGYFLIATSAINNITLPLFIGLGFVVIGRATASTCPPTIIASAYNGSDDPRLDSAYTFHYMANNIGAFLTMLVIPAIGSMVSMGVAFAVCGVGMAFNLCGLLIMSKLMKNAGSAPDHKAIGGRRIIGFLLGSMMAVCVAAFLLTNLTMANLVMAAGAVIICAMLYKHMRQEAPEVRRQMLVGMALMLQALVFFVLYKQMPTSLNFFAINNVQPSILGISVDPVQYQSLNPLVIILFSPVLAWLYNYLGARGKDFSMPGKYAIGMMFCALAFGSAGISRFFADETGMVSSFWIVMPNILFGIGELLISALGMSIIAKLFPARIRGFSYGAWYMTLGLSSVVGAWVAGFSTIEGSGVSTLDSLHTYSNYFILLAVATAAIALLITFYVSKLNRILNNSDNNVEHEVATA